MHLTPALKVTAKENNGAAGHYKLFLTYCTIIAMLLLLV